MEIKTKYQYTYFIYPYIINEKKFNKYLLKLLSNKKYKLKIFEKEKESEIYSYFLPKVRDYMFWNIDFSKNRIKKLNEFDNEMKSVILSKYPCTIFEYQIDNDIQGKTDNKDSIYFNIRNIEIICFNNGICFLNIKTTLDDNSTLADVCNFNYKFRDINSSIKKFKEYENIKIQTDSFQDIKGITTLIKDITGSNLGAHDLNIDTERFITYTYACIGQEHWNSNEELLNKEFYKFSTMQPADCVANYNNDAFKIDKSKDKKYACNKSGIALLTSDINTDNYTKIPCDYENKYLYHYIFELYKKISLCKINNELILTNQFEDTKQKFMDFVQKIWIEDITNDEIGNKFNEQCNSLLELNQLFVDVKGKYDLINKNINIEKTAKSNKAIICILMVLIVINLIDGIIMMINKS